MAEIEYGVIKCEQTGRELVKKPLSLFAQRITRHLDSEIERKKWADEDKSIQDFINNERNRQ